MLGFQAFLRLFGRFLGAFVFLGGDGNALGLWIWGTGEFILKSDKT